MCVCVCVCVCVKVKLSVDLNCLITKLWRCVGEWRYRVNNLLHCTEWRRVVSVTPWAPEPGLGVMEKGELVPFAGTEMHLLLCPAHSLVAVERKLSRPLMMFRTTIRIFNHTEVSLSVILLGLSLSQPAYNSTRSPSYFSCNTELPVLP
jgi:hypothetical protein